MRWLNHPWIFELGAEIYNWFNAQKVWRHSCARLVAHFPPNQQPPPLRVLDLGCGPGNTAIEIARARPDAYVIGLDRAWRMLNVARDETVRAGLRQRIGYVRADATAPPLC